MVDPAGVGNGLIVSDVFGHSIQLLENFGFFRVVLPMMLVFAMFYGMLVHSGIFGDDDLARNVSALISFVAAFLVVTATPIVEAINKLIPQVTYLLLVVMMMLLTIMFVFPGADLKTISASWKGVVVLSIILIFLAMVDVSTGLQIPFVHGLVQVVSGGADVGAEAFGFMFSLALIVGLPLAVMYIVTHGGKKERQANRI